MVSSFDNFKMHGLQAWLLHSAFMLSVVKMLLKGEVGGHALNGHGNYIVDHGKSWKNHGIVFLNFCGNPVLKQMIYLIRMHVNIFLLLACVTAFFAELQSNLSWSVSENAHNSETTWYIWIKSCILIDFNIDQSLVCKAMTGLLGEFKI